MLDNISQQIKGTLQPVVSNPQEAMPILRDLAAQCKEQGNKMLPVLASLQQYNNDVSNGLDALENEGAGSTGKAPEDESEVPPAVGSVTLLAESLDAATADMEKVTTAVNALAQSLDQAAKDASATSAEDLGAYITALSSAVEVVRANA
ncbi:hypothetical protein ACGFX8_33710 [Streptomyces sp. NPDC048362]|uniref:hypothetical protein n=1 Tax=Streptomyces sp. NPDC048362 TaxID=3365539 RepID=UPI0037180562